MEERLEERLDRRRREGSLRSLLPLPKAFPNNDENKNKINDGGHRSKTRGDGDAESKRQANQTFIDFASNDYLGLARCPQQHAMVQTAYQKLFNQDRDDKERISNDENINNGTSSNSQPYLGATGSRLLSGDSELARNLERYLASPRVHDRSKALIFNSGYDANLSILSSLPYDNSDNNHDGDGGGDAVIMDELAHNSLVMGVRMGRLHRNRLFFFRHNDINDLRRLLANLQKEHSTIKSSKHPTKHSMKHSNNEQTSKKSGQSIVVVVESVYSMDGDVAPLKQILDVAHENNAVVMVDEAHGLGVYGRTNVQDISLQSTINDIDDVVNSQCGSNSNGEIARDHTKQCGDGGGMGVLAALDLHHHPALLCSVHTFGKAAGCHGAVVSGSDTLISYLVNYARPFVYSTALPPHSLIAIQMSYDTMLGTEGERRRRILFQRVRLFRQLLSQGFVHFKSEFPHLDFDLLPSPSPIQAVIVPGNDKCMSVCNYVRMVGGFDVYPIRSPTVAKGKERIRIILHYHNSEEEVTNLVHVLLKGLRQCAISPDVDGILSKI